MVKNLTISWSDAFINFCTLLTQMNHFRTKINGSIIFNIHEQRKVAKTTKLSFPECFSFLPSGEILESCNMNSLRETLLDYSQSKLNFSRTTIMWIDACNSDITDCFVRKQRMKFINSHMSNYNSCWLEKTTILFRKLQPQERPDRRNISL